MIIDYGQLNQYPGVVVYPDFPYPNLPTPPGSIHETIILGGSSTGTSVSVGGVADQPEN